jgi:hypothetical protein
MSILCAFALIVSLSQNICAQSVDTASQRADIARTQTETAAGAETSTVTGSPNDADLGEQQILQRAATAYQAFTVATSVPIYWTSNVTLARSGEQSDVIEAPVAGFYYQPRFTDTLFGLLDVRNQQFYYDRFGNLDFGDFAVDGGFNMILPQMDNLVLRAQYTYDRLTKKDSFDAFFENHAIIVNAELPVRIGRAQQLAFGMAATLSLRSIPETPRRNDYEAYVGYTLALTRDFTVNAVGRVVVRDYYHENSREDFSEVLALTATYAFNRFISASALSTFAANQSSQSVFDYKVGNAGGALSLAVKF